MPSRKAGGLCSCQQSVRGGHCPPSPPKTYPWITGSTLCDLLLHILSVDEAERIIWLLPAARRNALVNGLILDTGVWETWETMKHGLVVAVEAV